MTPGDNVDRFAQYVDQYISYLDGEAGQPMIEHLGTEDQQELFAMFRIIEANWVCEIEMPSFEEDPLAIALGLVPSTNASVSVLVAGARVHALRKAMHLKRSELAAAVSTNGWPATLSEISRLERAPAEMLPAHQAAALARALSTEIEYLVPSPGDPDGKFVAWLYSEEFDQVVANWSAEHDRAFDAVVEEARDKMLAPARRSSGPIGPTQWIWELYAILEAME